MNSAACPGSSEMDGSAERSTPARVSGRHVPRNDGLRAVATMTTRVLRAIDRFHSTHPWDHNAHHHRWIMRQVPRCFDRALDIGSGSGDLARLLATRATGVQGVDVDRAIVAKARELTGPAVPVTFTASDALTETPPGPYDVITCVAALHHLPFSEALTHFRRRPGAGRDPGRRRGRPGGVPRRSPPRRCRDPAEHRHGLDQEQGAPGTTAGLHDRSHSSGDHDLRRDRPRGPPRSARGSAAQTSVLALHLGLASAAWRGPYASP